MNKGNYDPEESPGTLAARLRKIDRFIRACQGLTLLDKLIDALIERAKRTPYFHLHHADNSLYMERYWLVPFASEKEGCHRATWLEPFTWLLQRLGVAVRLHCIHTPDLDRALHDHPWTFASLVLRGWYKEERPTTPNNVKFDFFYEFVDLPPIPAGLPTEYAHEANMMRVSPPVIEVHREPSYSAIRTPGSFAVRRFHERHRITAVSPGGVWTLFISFRKRQSWGFFTPEGKVWWWVFESVHNNKPIK